MDILPKHYDPQALEEQWYAHWESRGFFRAETDSGRTPFCITIPPPNVTGELHMGHAMQHAIHDAVVRWKRMQGYETLCLPGTDHAGIATQMKVEEELGRTEGKNRYDLGRAAFLERVWIWKEKYGGAILSQMRKLGLSYDWRRTRFTLDKEYAEAVLRAFERFAGKGWIYRGTRMINWCPSCGTVISDLETEEGLVQGKLWHIRYPGAEGGPDVVVATTRPETMLGDTGVAVHPADLRWQSAVGKLVRLPLMDRLIPIVPDEYADPEMGSGAVKITPAHDPNDYEVGQRHHLPQIQVIGFDGHMTEAAGAYQGLDRLACRRAVVRSLEEAGLLVKADPHEHAVPHHDKCGTAIEPLLMEQWFMDMKALACEALPFIERGEIGYTPDRFRIYAAEWLRNIRDWAISRQIWWGHRIPAWYCRTCSGPGLIPLGGMEPERALAEGSFRVSVEKGARPVVGIEAPGVCQGCGGAAWVQDPDVLDTWFSSALWPFATLGWPRQTRELSCFYPTDLMITARDILHLWVLRMAMTSLECVGQIPFRRVLVHPTVLTKDGRRMSKSLGTGLNPLDLVRLYGADATRFSLLYQAGAVQDVRFDAEIKDNQVKSSAIAETGRNFGTKLWNAARFVLMNLEDYAPAAPDQHPEELADRWILSRLARVIAQVNACLAEYRFSEAVRALYEFVWHDYCDWYLELAKLRLCDKGGKGQVQQVLVQTLEQVLRLLHPVMPFLTEALWQALPASARPAAQGLMVAPWPEETPQNLAPEAESQMQSLQELVTAVRTLRSEMNIPPGKKTRVVISTQNQQELASLEKQGRYLEVLTRAEPLEMGLELTVPRAAGSKALGQVEVHVVQDTPADAGLERQRLGREIAKFQKLLQSQETKLTNPQFIGNAPPEVVEKERQRRAEYHLGLARLQASLEGLGT
ncbi:MAG: valine--tRNA ligase [Candidatus Latescibacteria bacterium]|nr:valine--tRNA ligase [Candidatus Latescibacterota bacterium]